ncbi:transposase, partial [mine drainage metagenome]
KKNSIYGERWEAMNSLIARGFSKSRASGLVGISRSMLYYNEKPREQRFDPDLEGRMKSLVEERPSYGSRRITAMLHRQGVLSGRNRIRRHMRHLNLMHSSKKTYRKKVPRILLVSRPNVMWETDFTKIYIEGEGWCHLSAYIDLCSRKIKGYLVSRMVRTAEMIQAADNALLNAFPDLKIPHLILRSDNGSQLTSRKYEEYLKSFGIYHETIHPHTPEEDAYIESYFGHFKEDYIYSREFKSFDEFSNYMDWAVNDYNSVRPHSSLNYLTPDEFE